jgi:hypothetical protein
MNRLNFAFSKKYSFIPAQTSYGLMKGFVNMKAAIKGKKDLLMSRVPMNLRLAKLSSYEKTMVMMFVMFFVTVQYLGNFVLIQKNTRD